MTVVPPPDTPRHDPPRITVMGRLRAYLFAGILVTAPAAITFYTAWALITWVDQGVRSLIPARYDVFFPGSIPGLGVIALLLALILIGMLTAGFVGRFVVHSWESLLARMPIIRSVYAAIKQIFETVLAQQSTAFRQVVLVEYPRKGLWVLGFVSGTTGGEVEAVLGEDCVNVFIPTTPNPTSGFLLFVPRTALKPLTMSVEDGIKLVVSGGLITPTP